MLVLVFLWGVWNIDKQNQLAQKDSLKFHACCDTISYVVEQPLLRFSGFQMDEIDQVKVELLHRGNVYQDTIMRVINSQIHIPFQQFLTSDSIVITVNNQLRYDVSGFHYEVYLHYGMFGYLGSYECRLSPNCIINGQQSLGIIRKDDAVEAS